ncbi:potassium transporter TrkG [Psychromarinibacter sp. C21-152]|uniref:Potassium transporter TrkG n=1 Tax=Psychromarinibacter sediminicola TaxID=3033385 RepID=A0AAE3T9Q5_9RHOB|nr:potassium transporter TrkG [Psychromarinibacter sediminicola]MDF0602048.1 potassium transporter TrkG [Psychromarinibacter sediminicola]
MWARILGLPLIVLLTGIGAASMLLPAAYAAAAEDWADAQAFLFSALIGLALAAMIGVAVANYEPRRQARSHLLALLGAYVLLPAVLAVPLWDSVGDTRFLNAYFEMVSSLTTTGATVYDDPGRLSGAAHLWRALVGWMGGFLVWVTAVAIMAPLNLGGFEVLGERGDSAAGAIPQITEVADPQMRLRRYAVALLPIYTALTLALWVGLLVMGDAPLVAASHAMSTLATSGISPVGGTTGAASGFGGELLIFLFFGFALSRRTFEREGNVRRRRRLLRDPELRMGAGLAVLVPLFIFLRHWWGAFEVEAGSAFLQGVRALWGSVFTVLSFLSTTGFESADWAAAQAWSGLKTPGLILMGLALVGGGVATTAGGVKLLRCYALYKHGIRELDRLVHPHSIGGEGGFARHLRTRGAYIAWIFFMLFAISIAGVMLALSLTGLDFDTATVLTIAALSNTGPLAGIAEAEPIRYALLTDPAKWILMASMVLGRLETLVIVALLNPEFWRG